MNAFMVTDKYLDILRTSEKGQPYVSMVEKQMFQQEIGKICQKSNHPVFSIDRDGVAALTDELIEELANEHQ